MRKFFSKFAQKFTILSILIIGGIVVQAITSCSGDSGGSNGDPSANSGTETSSSSIEGGQSSSAQASGSDSGPVKKDKISGFSQKGPFTKGSAITLSELNDKLAQTGRSFEEMITDDKGSFEIKNVELVSPYAVLKVNGYYRNEVSGKISTAPINLYAIADIREKSNVNVNILTHLEYYRVQKLVEGGKSLKDAKKQAQKEILAVFGISGEFKDSEDMSIFGTSDGDAALLAISVLLQGDLSEGQFTERLADFNLGFRETGSWDNKTAKDAMAAWASAPSNVSGQYCRYSPTSEYPDNCWPMPTEDNCQTGSLVSYCSNPNMGSALSNIRSNILAWNLSSAVPDFEKYVNNYWYINYGLGACDAKQQGGIKKSNRDVDYICKDNAWKVATQYERDTYQWGACSKEGEIKNGQVSDTKYICKNKVWSVATQYELDVGLENCSTAGEVKKGNVSDTKYICKDKVWEIASQYELDVGGLGNCSTAGEIKKGNVSDNKYACRNGEWQTPPKYIDEKCLESKSCQTFTDARDKQSYYSVKIGTQTWMAENLNYAADSSRCYNNELANCAKYGRLYDWATAMGIDAKYNCQKWGGSDVKHKGICPTGWHIPSDAEWQTLVDFAGGEAKAGTKLKATGDWNSYSGVPQGSDTYGFAALPGGYRVGRFYDVGNYGYWWSATEGDDCSHLWIMLYNSESVGGDYDYIGTSVRCVKD